MRVERSVEIAATPARVWRILTDFDRYAEWNPLIRRAAGVPRVGSRLSLTIRPPGTWGRSSHAVIVRAEPERELAWVGQVIGPWLLRAEHGFRLESTAPGRTRLIQEETFSGILTHLFRRRLTVALPAGFEQMNDALRRLAERDP